MVKVCPMAGEGGRLFGAVTAKEISDCLSQQHGLNIAKTKLVLEEPIKACGSYSIKAKLGYEVTGTVNVVVTEGKSAPYVPTPGNRSFSLIRFPHGAPDGSRVCWGDSPAFFSRLYLVISYCYMPRKEVLQCLWKKRTCC